MQHSRTDFINKLTAFGYTTNILGLDKNTFASVLVTDVLNASTTGVTSFYNGTQVLTGRALADDVIDVELTLIFGGATGGSNPGLTSDHVNGNDKPFPLFLPLHGKSSLIELKKSSEGAACSFAISNYST